jgi:formate hydrogenlyase subunit 3/multisubunit Na+/H+ antiporter MnhD subunit
MNPSVLIVPILIPLGAGILILLIPGRDRWSGGILALAAGAAAFASSLGIALGEVPDLRRPLLELGGFTLRLDLARTPLAAFILPFAAGFALLISLYSLFYLEKRHRPREFQAFLLFALAGSAGVLLADHLILFLIFWEIVSASLYFLVALGGPEARAGATKTFAMLGAGDACLLLGIGLLWQASGSFSLGQIRVPVDGWLPAAAFLLMMAGAITKAGAMPFHSWIPAASEGAPAPAMALLPAAIDKLLGIYLLVRLVTGLFTLTGGLGLLLMIAGAVTILAAVMMAMVQHDLRRLLAYHAISQVGYMLLGIGTLTPVGIAGGLFHMLNHSIYKSCLFLCAGAVEKKAGSTELGELGGLARAMPVTFSACLVSALAISGVPPFNGFVSKWLVYQGVIGTGSAGALLFLIAAMFGSALTLASFVKVIYSVFLGARTGKTAGVAGEVSFGMQLPLILLAALSLLFGVYYRFPLESLILPGLGIRIAPAGTWDSPLAAGLIALGLILGLVIYLVGRIARSSRTVGAFTGGEELDRETGRVPGTRFYDTIRSAAPLSGIYAAQEKGRLDPYLWAGGLGLGFTGLLRRIHNGLLSWYLSWSLAGIAILIALLILVR